MTINQFRQLAAYNRWANARLYAAALDLSDQAYRLHIGVFFGSLHGTLNHGNAKWTWVAPNILLSLALIRSARPYVQILLQRHGWAAFAWLVSGLFAVSSIAGKIVDYGSEGWLWALFGLCQRMYVDSRSATDVNGPAQSSASPAPAMKENAGLMRLLAWFAAVVAYVWQ